MRVGVCARTGKVLTGWDHCVQSIGRCLRTRVNSRPLRRHLGAEVPELQDANADVMTIFRVFTAIAEALADPDGGEPGFRLSRIEVTAAPRQGRFMFILSGTFFPLGHLGDWSTHEDKSLTWPEALAA